MNSKLFKIFCVILLNTLFIFPAYSEEIPDKYIVVLKDNDFNASSLSISTGESVQ